MADTSEPEPCGILKEIKIYVDVIQRLVKSHDHQNNLQELGDQVCHDNKSDKCGNSSSLSTISQYIDKIDQVINEQAGYQLIHSSSIGQQTMGNLTGEVSVMESDSTNKALNNSVVLRTIMEHLDDRDLLLSCRLVSKLWKEEATIQLLSTRQNIQVKFRWDDKELKFLNKIGTLKEFIDSCYGNPLRKFPCSQFYFVDFATYLQIDKGNVDLFNFFSNHGHHIKNLHLYLLTDSVAALDTIRKIIIEWTPGLRSLTLEGGCIKNKDEDEPSSQRIEDKSKWSSKNSLQLPNLSLEHLEILWAYSVVGTLVADEQWTLLVQDILSWAPNLKTISDQKLWFTKEIVSTGKIGAVRHLKWEDDQGMKLRYVEFSRVLPQLTVLEADLRFFRHEIPRCESLPSLLLILQSSRDTLKTLKFNGRLDLLDGTSHVDFPIMKNLQQFKVASWNCWEDVLGRGRLWHPRLSIQKSFPRLKILNIQDVGDFETEEGLDNPFDYDCNSSTTVQELTISTSALADSHFQASSLSRARDLYPNVRVLHLDFCGTMDEMPEIFHTIWKYWNDSLLEELNIGLPELDSNSAEIMDQALTGFDQETCKLLRRQRGSGHGHGEEEYKRGPSILDMKKLKLFQLTFHFEEDSDGSPMFSRVSVIHAFEPMRRRQNLRVEICGVELKDMILHSNVDFSVCQGQTGPSIE